MWPSGSVLGARSWLVRVCFGCSEVSWVGWSRGVGGGVGWFGCGGFSLLMMIVPSCWLLNLFSSIITAHWLWVSCPVINEVICRIVSLVPINLRLEADSDWFLGYGLPWSCLLGMSNFLMCWFSGQRARILRCRSSISADGRLRRLAHHNFFLRSFRKSGSTPCLCHSAVWLSRDFPEEKCAAEAGLIVRSRSSAPIYPIIEGLDYFYVVALTSYSLYGCHRYGFVVLDLVVGCLMLPSRVAYGSL